MPDERSRAWFVLTLVIAGLLFAFIQFWCYNMIRTFDGGDPTLVLPVRRMAGSLVFGAIMGCIGAVPWALITWWATFHICWTPRQVRAEQGLCQACGYPRQDSVTVCTECGRNPLAVARPKAVALRTLAWVAVVWMVSTVAASAAGEAWVALDDWSFRSAVKAGGGAALWRARWWPNGNTSLMYDPARGYWAND